MQKKADNGDTACVAQLIDTQNKLNKTSPNIFRISKCPQIRGEQNIHCPNAKQAKTKRMQSLQDQNGSVTVDAEKMTNICRSFYEDLYTAVPVDQTEIEFFLESIDGSLSEIKKALFDMEACKTPGLDGLPAEFYRTFFSEMGDTFGRS